jgi:hypothetical protein
MKPNKFRCPFCGREGWEEDFPDGECPGCGGKPEALCSHCDGTGWINHGWMRGMICGCQGDKIPLEMK